MKRSIVIFEPQCIGFEHSLLNAAFLSTIANAYPDWPMEFLAEGKHIEYVRTALEKYDAHTARSVAWESVPIAERESTGAGRLRSEWPSYRDALVKAKQLSSPFVLLTSVTSTGMLALNAAIRATKTETPVLTVVHSILGAVLRRKPRRPFNRLTDPSVLLRLPQPANLRYIVLGRSIIEHLRSWRAGVASHFSAVDMPYFWASDRISEPDNADVLRFGFLGVSGRKSLKDFAELAADLKTSHSNAEFDMVGFVNVPSFPLETLSGLNGVSTEPLADEEFTKRASRLTYAVLMNHAPDYRLAASATFVDTMSHVKPCVCLRNPFIEHYFDRFGDIGYCCDGIAELRSTIANLLEDWPADRYRAQCERILQSRSAFEPASVGAQLSEILHGLV